MTRIESDFGGTSEADAARGRRLRQLILAGTGVALAVAAVVFFSISQRAKKSEAEARDNLAIANDTVILLRVEEGRESVLDDEPLEALVYLSDAYERGASGAPFRYLLAQALAAVETDSVVLAGHVKTLRFSDVSSDSSLVVTASDDGAVVLWDRDSGAELRRMAGDGVLYRALFSPDDATIAVSSLSGHARLFRTADGAQLHQFDHRDKVYWVEFSPDGRFVFTASADGRCGIWSVETGELVRMIEAGAPVGRVSVSPDSSLVAVGTLDEKLAVYDVEGGQERYSLTGSLTAPLWRSAFSQDGRRLAAHGDDGVVRIVDARTGANPIRLEGHTEPVTAATWSGDSLVTVSGEKAVVWDARRGVARFELPGAGVRSAAVSKESGHILTGGDDTVVTVWTADGQEQATMHGHDGPIRHLLWLPDDDFVSFAGDGTARVWRRRERALATARYRESESESKSKSEVALVAAVGGAWRADGGFSLFGHEGVKQFDASGKLVDDSDRTPTTAIVRRNDGLRIVARVGAVAIEAGDGPPRTLLLDGPARRLALSADGRYLAVGSEADAASLWSVESGEKVAMLEGHKGTSALAFYDGGTKLLTASRGGDVYRWEVPSGKQLSKAKLDAYDVSCAQLSSDESWLIVGGMEGKLSVVSAADDQKLSSSDDRWAGGVRACTLHPSDELVALASADSVIVVSRRDGRVLSKVEMPNVLTLLFSPDGRRLLAIDHDGRARVLSSETEIPSVGAVAELARCQAPYELRDGLLYAAERPDDCAD